MAIPTSKTELLAAIAVSFEKLAADLAKVPPHCANDPAMDGHTAGSMMSAADLVAYLIGWNELVLKWLAYDDAGTPCELPETGYKWNQLGQLAQKFYADYADLDWPTRLAHPTGPLAQRAGANRPNRRQPHQHRALRQTVVWQMDQGTDDPTQLGITLCKRAGTDQEMATANHLARNPSTNSLPQTRLIGKTSIPIGAICNASHHVHRRFKENPRTPRPERKLNFKRAYNE